MYHYVEPQSDARKGIHPCEPDEFERQVAFLARSYTIGTPQEVYEAAHGHSSERKAAFTFDDGLLDNYEIAAPILERFGMRGTFFPFGIALEGGIPFTQETHVLLSSATAWDIAERINEMQASLEIPKLLLNQPLDPTRRFDDVATRNVKEYMLRLASAPREKLMQALFERFGVDRKRWHAELFMTREQLRELRARGHSIGNHSFGHEAYDRTPEWLADIERAQTVLESAVGERPDLFAYPHGCVPADLAESENALHKSGIRYALTTEPRGVEPDDSQLRIPRFDCNDIRDHLNASLL